MYFFILEQSDVRRIRRDHEQRHRERERERKVKRRKIKQNKPSIQNTNIFLDFQKLNLIVYRNKLQSRKKQIEVETSFIYSIQK